MEWILELGQAVGDMAYDAGIYVIFGVLAAGLVHVFISRELLTRHLGGRGLGPVTRAALVGAPLPLCSCSVLPTAFALRERGAGRGATVSFLISTPETSIDSIALTWALMGPLMAVVRPVAAVVTAVAAGVAETFGAEDEDASDAEPDEAACPHCAEGQGKHVVKPRRWSRFWRFAVLEMGDEIGPTLALGLLLAGIVAAVVPGDFFSEQIGSPTAMIFLMLLVGLPLYVCAAASTPLAASLVMKGLNPGAALVLLLVGPATNLATVLTVGRMLGRRSAVIYVTTIVIFSLACGFALDAVVVPIAGDAAIAVDHASGLVPPWVQVAGAGLLGLWLAVALGRWVWRKIPRGQPVASCCTDEATPAAEQGDACCAGDAVKAAPADCCNAEDGPAADDSDACCEPTDQ